MPKPQFTALCARLCRLIQTMSVDAETSKEADEFYSILERVMAMRPEQEALVYSTCEDMLRALGDLNSVIWLAEELEHEVMMDLRPGRRGRTDACVLFAIPVVLSAEDSLEFHASENAFSELARVLEESQVISDQARFALVNRVFSATDFLCRTHGELKRLAVNLADQVQEGESTLRVPADFEAEPAHGANACPDVRLHFVLGMAVIDDEHLEELFPTLPGLPDEAHSRVRGLTQVDDDGTRGYLYQQGEVGEVVMLEPGMTDNGLTWEQAFQTAFDDAFETMEGALTAIAPQGLYEDLRAGQECAREVGLMLAVRNHVPADAPGPLRAELTPKHNLLEGDGIGVSLRFSPDPTVAALELHWPVLGQESLDAALRALALTLDDSNIRIESSFGASAASAPVSLRLH